MKSSISAKESLTPRAWTFLEKRCPPKSSITRKNPADNRLGFLVFVDHADGGFGVVFQNLQGIVHETGDGGERVGEFGFGENDGSGPPGGQAQAGADVDEVGVGLSIDLRPLVKIARGGDGAVLERES